MALRKVPLNFFNKHEIAWEILMIVLAIVFVIIGFLPYLIPLSSEGLNTLEVVDWGITGFFILEFVARLSISVSKKAYLKDHWLDLIALVPPVRWFRLARIAHIIRLLRLARLVRGLNTLDRWYGILARFARMNGLQWAILAFTLIMLISSGLFYLFEHQVNEKVRTYWDALYASLVTWTTPGYGDIAPVTTSGRICGVVLIVSGLITWGILIANLASFLSSRRDEDKTIDPAVHDIRHKLARLDDLSQKELISLRGSVTALIDHKLTRPADIREAFNREANITKAPEKYA